MFAHIEEFITTLVVALATGVVWLFRTVFTNQKEIAILREDIQARREKEADNRAMLERIRNEDRAILLEIKADFKAELRETKEDIGYIRSELTELWKTK